MWKFARGVVIGLALIGAGWIGGSIYPAPQSITGALASRVPNLARRLGIDQVTLDRLARFMSRDQMQALRRDVSEQAARAGEVIMVEQISGPVEMQADEIPQASSASGAFEAHLALCPSMAVSNAPPADANRVVRNYAGIVSVQGVRIAVAPTQGACLSSAVGNRNGRMHKGIDLYSPTGGPIFAGGAGIVRERKYRDDYGNMLLIDHGGGVFTRYAHLSSFAAGVVVGARVSSGQQLGLMGNTASYRIPVHLHYELLLGNYDTPQASFGLIPHSPFEYLAAR